MLSGNNRQLAAESLEQRQLFCADVLCFHGGEPVCGVDSEEVLPAVVIAPEGDPRCVDGENALPNAGSSLPDVDSRPVVSPEVEQAIEELGEELSRIYKAPPRLNDIPYLSRLFQNCATNPESTSSMLMVTPRLIIQLESDE